MSAINGTSLLLYSEGVLVAMQKGLSISVEQDLPDATNKESAGWARHINGMLSAGIDFDALFSTGKLSDTPAVMGAKDLMDYIINRESMLLEILGLDYPMVGEVDMSSLKIGSPAEGAMTLAGSLKVKGELYVLASLPAGKYANLLTDPDGTSTDYDTFSHSGTTITDAINLAGEADARSNTFAITDGDVFKVVTFLRLISDQVPSIGLFKVGDDFKTNVEALAPGLNIITLTATASETVVAMLYNTGAARWTTSPIYIFKV